ncbi:alpha/beta fold hydrolase [Sphingorhabdus sp.]|uniref:alpha/beta fold hydrolase n=1 Tax=Sphingorhabdus sp. TaxID=1902408 RepID=UPI0035B08C80|nr:alpha/beta hydrolase [Sphingomonadaceae bacterium]
MAEFEDGYWASADELRLHYRNYTGPASRAPLVCMPGLTRNARDFEPVANLLNGKRRMLAIDFRGRGESAHAKDPMTYMPITYAQDMDLLLRELNLKKFVLFGTSLGGIVSMLLAPQWKDRLAGVILNDVGPEIGKAGAERIRAYVGQGRSFETWMHAARAMAEAQGDVYPGYGLEEWLRFAKRTCKLASSGRIVFDYDMKISEPFKLPGGEAGVDLWPLYDLLLDVPMLILRGEKSDILEKATAAKMVKKAKQAQLVTIKGIGHAPSLDEPDAQLAIAGFLKSLK